METLEKLVEFMTGKDIRDAYKAAKILKNTEKQYFGKELTEKEREIKYKDKDFRKIVEENLEKQGLGNYYN